MKIYFAGSSATAERENIWLNTGLIGRLISYYIHFTDNKPNQDTEVIFERKKDAKNKRE